MKGLHVHVSVDVLAKWMLDDPRVNFAISKRGSDAGIRHLGIQVEDRAELADMYSRLQRAEADVLNEGATTCCYAKSEKSWVADPQGVQWETFLTSGESTTYGANPSEQQQQKRPCCEPARAAG